MERRSHAHPILAATLFALGALLLLATTAGAVAPSGKHYAVTLILFDPGDREVETSPSCLSFSKGELCDELGDCGTWEFVKREGRQNEWTAEFTMDGIEVDLHGVTERDGPRSSIGGTVRASAQGVTINGGFAGAAAPLSVCMEFGLSDESSSEQSAQGFGRLD